MSSFTSYSNKSSQEEKIANNGTHDTSPEGKGGRGEIGEIWLNFIPFQADSVIMVEIQPLNNSQHNLNIFASYEKIPTFRSFEYHTKVSDLPKNETLADFKYNFWFLNNTQIQNRTGGRWFISIMELSEDLTQVILL